MRSTSVPSSGTKAQVVFKQLDRYEDVGNVASVLNEKKIVVLNLETCPNDVSVRIIDF
jgi:FtsZ-interacting cell division protein YlmF